MDALIFMSGLYEDEGFRPEGFTTYDFRGLEGTCAYCSAEAEEALERALRGVGRGGMHFIDTGDYHYLSEILLRSSDAPFELLLWDNHPDDQASAFGDGGPLSCGSWVQRLRERNPFCRSTRWIRSEADFGAMVGEELPVYLSIDLDVLREDDARTNWDQGQMTLEELCREVAAVLEERTVAGVDICGGLTASKGGRSEDFAVNLQARGVLQELLRGR